MGVPVDEVIARSDRAVVGLGHAPSTLMQYRWAWSQIARYCCERGDDGPTKEAAASFLLFAAEGEYAQGRIKEFGVSDLAIEIRGESNNIV